MRAYSYEGIEFIYPSGRRLYTFHHTNWRKLQVEIVLSNELPQCNVRYFYINNMHEFHALALMVASSLQNISILTQGAGNIVVEKKKEISVYISKMDAEKPKKLCEKFELSNVHFFDVPQHLMDQQKSLEETNSAKCVLE